MNEITQIRKLSLWIFFIPLLAINLCLFISQNPEFLNNTFLEVDQIGRSGFTIPYLDGSVSISRASRTYPQFLVFKPSMILTALFLLEGNPTSEIFYFLFVFISSTSYNCYFHLTPTLQYSV